MAFLSNLIILILATISDYGSASSNSVYDDTGRCTSTRPFYFSPTISRRPATSKQFIYQVVIDAGSTGSRIHIFTFRRTLAGLIFEKSFYEEIKPGLSFYLDRPQEGAYSISGLLKQALTVVPKNEWESTPVTLKATAGLRLLPQLVAEKILKQVRELLMLCPFKTHSSNVISIMDGDDEGIFAWTTLNFLTSNLNNQSQKTLGALDLGGGSTQIVFKPMLQETVLTSPKSHLNTVKILGTQHNLYSHSYLGLGLMSARDAVFEFTSLKHVNGSAHSISASPCMLPHYEGIWSYSGKEIIINGNSSFSYETCHYYVKQVVTQIHQPVEIVDRAFYAFSYYYDIAIDLGLITPGVGGPLSLGSYIKATKKVCSDEGKGALANVPFLCLDAVYVTTLLRNGYGFQETQVFQVARRINNVELSWALGAALHMLH